MAFEIEKMTGPALAPLPENARVQLSALRIINVTYCGFDGAAHEGRMVCDKELAAELTLIFSELAAGAYQIERIALSCEFGGDDDLLMAGNISSCFNYRTVANTDTLSLHALGRAVDINPLYNPYIQKGVIMPPDGAPYADRTADFPHKIDHEDLCFKTFAKYGWKWGGDWTDDVDYQHFYKPQKTLKNAVRTLMHKN